MIWIKLRLKLCLNELHWELEAKDPMYACVCNAIRERDVRACVTEKGARTPLDVFRAMGAEPRCCMCLPDIRRIVAEALRETEAIEQAFALAQGIDRLAS